MQKVGTYWHMLPQAGQARKAIWEAINPHTGKRRIDEAFPLEIRATTREQDMMIKFVNGATWQVVGSDNYNSLVGSPPVGVVFSEWALADPQAWPYIEPILEENGGWALFITTPRGRNHAATFFDMALSSPSWFAEKQSADSTGVFDPEQLDRIRSGLVKLYGEDEGGSRFDQEYYVSFDAALPGAYFGKEMNGAENDGRISGVPYVPGVPVYPCFDFGIGQSNSTAITFMQMAGNEPHVIDYHEDNSGRIDDYGKLLNDKGYVYGKLILPHDAGHKRLATGLSYQEQFEAMGFEVEVLPQTPDKQNDINIARQFIEMCWFDKINTSRLAEALRNYHREWDVVTKTFKRSPKHDWSSHGSDSFMQAAVAHKNGMFKGRTVKRHPYLPQETAQEHWLDM